MENTVVPVKMTITLKQRIDELAQKGMTNRNHWIVKALHNAAYKHKPRLSSIPNPNEHKRVKQ